MSLAACIQTDLSALAGELDRPFLSAIENGRRNASLETVERLAVALGIEPIVLFEFD